MFFGAAEMILGTATDPIIIRMRGRAVAHDFGNYFKSFFKFEFHRSHRQRSWTVLPRPGTRILVPGLIIPL
jgi:hypothetical protein